ncbi:MAG: carbohydrate ABC transporter permease [Oscillospiraceae bacterium]|nr:carbohydrate ABC transporter permease [Oscillospiraceae bacterium]
MTATKSRKTLKIVFKTFIYIICIFLSVLSVLPFLVMVMNSTRNSVQIMQSPLSLLPSGHLLDNFKPLTRGNFNPLVGFKNSMMISVGATVCATYFSSITAYALSAYDWRFRKAFFSFVVAVMMLPAQISAIGFYQFMYRLDLVNSFLPFILPAIASPAIVFFMRQYLLSTFSIDIVNAARIDGANEFYTFNRIVLPMMKPAIAMQAIFVFVGTWNQLLLPMILLTNQDKQTMPIMVRQLNGNFYRTEYGAIYLGLTLSVLPLFVVYFSLSRYIIAGVQLGGVKE